MSPSLKHFGSAAEGKIPQSATQVTAVAMGKTTPAAFDVIAEQIGHGLAVGRIDPTQIAIEANAAHAIKATPGGGLQATGDEDVRYKPSPDNELLFTGRQSDIGGIKPTGP